MIGISNNQHGFVVFHKVISIISVSPTAISTFLRQICTKLVRLQEYSTRPTDA